MPYESGNRLARKSRLRPQTQQPSGAQSRFFSLRRQRNLEIGDLNLFGKSLPGPSAGTNHGPRAEIGEVPGNSHVVFKNGVPGRGPSTRDEEGQAEGVKSRRRTPPPTARQGNRGQSHDVANERQVAGKDKYRRRSLGLGHSDITHMFDPQGEHRRSIRFTFEKRFVVGRRAFPNSST